MRVAFGQCFTDDRRDHDWARRLRRTAEHLASRGHDITVFCTRWWPEETDTTERNRVTYRAVTETPSPDSFALRLPIELARASQVPDVIHTTVTEPWTVLACRTYGTIRRVPIVADWYGDDPSVVSTDSRMWQFALRAPAKIITPSRYVKRTLRERGGHGDRITVIPESINTGLIESIEPAGDADIVYSGRLDRWANVEPVLLALAELRDRGWHAAIIGDGPARDEYEAQAADLRIDDRIDFTGALPLPVRLARFKQAHVFVQTASQCSFATELLWALAAGCVGVVEYQTNSSAHELVEGHPRGFRSTGDEELAEAIAAAGELPRHTTDDTFDAYDHDQVLEQYLSLYRDLIGLGG